LQTLNPELPIVVELQDTSKINFDNGKFSLSFNGFKTKQDDNETKEISILEAMVDTNVLSKDIADKFRTLTNIEAQNKYYKALFDTLEKNINTLRANDLDSKTAVTATIKEMADETVTNQEQANRINSCGDNQSCMDSEIKKISDELIITDEEADEIKAKEQSNQDIANSDGKEVQYGKWVKPSQSACESGGGKYKTFSFSLDDNTKYEGTEYTECDAFWENANNICSAIGGVLPNYEILKAVVTDCRGVLGDYENNLKNEAYQTCYREKGFSSFFYWSASTDVSDSSNAWTVLLGSGYDYWRSKTDEYSVRCVRGGQ